MGKCKYYYDLKKFGLYKISEVTIDYNYEKAGEYIFTLSEYPEGEMFFYEFFITLKEYRKQKINQLCLE